MQGAQHISDLAAVAALAVPLAPVCDHKGCSDPALFAYVWDWGEKGLCCSKHQFELNQTAGNISRTIQFSPLQTVASPPLQRDERAQLMAAVLVRDAELEEAKSRGLSLYNDNTQLQTRIHTLVVRERESEAQLQDARAKASDAETRARVLESTHGNLVEELERLRVLVSRPPPEVAELAERARSADLKYSARDTELRAALGELEKVRSELRVAEASAADARAEAEKLRGLVGEGAPGSEGSSVGEDVPPPRGQSRRR